MTLDPLRAPSISRAIVDRCLLSGSKTAVIYRTPARWRELSWSEIFQRLRAIAGGLKAKGIKQGDRVAILSQTRVEWILCDFACQTLGIVTVPIYASNLPEEVKYILQNSQVKLVFVEDRNQLAKFKSISQELPSLKTIVVLDQSVGNDILDSIAVIGLQNLETGPEVSVEELKAAANRVKPSDLMTLIYTSGTTGVPKGARILHQCMMHLHQSISVFQLGEKDRLLTFLPLAHVLGRFEIYLTVTHELQSWLAQNVGTIADDLPLAKPTILISVPRIYEKVYGKIMSTIKEGNWIKRQLFDWAVYHGGRVRELREKKQPVPPTLLAKHLIADQLVFSKIRARFGGKLRVSISGGAPISKDLMEFLLICGIPIYEGYGLTETTAPFTLNTPEARKLGTVGKPLGDMQVRIASDGEILAKGTALCDGYENNPEANQESFDSEGWFHTGDIGEIQDGFLAITDRKKDIIVTSAGKNIAPQPIENMLKIQPLVSQALIVGDRQKYIGALVTLDRQKVEDYARFRGLKTDSYENIVKSDALKAVIDEGIKHVNQNLPNYATIKRYHVLPRDFTIESGELTPSLKVKRKVCLQRYHNEISDLFS